MGKLNLRRFLEDRGVSVMDWYRAVRDCPIRSMWWGHGPLDMDKPLLWIWDSFKLSDAPDTPDGSPTWCQLEVEWEEEVKRCPGEVVAGMCIILEPGELPGDDLALALWVAGMERDYKEDDDG